MKIKRISFIEAGAFGFQMLSKFSMARVGTILLSTMLKERGYEVKAFIEDIAAPDWSFVESSDLVCVSTLTPTAIRAYTIALKAVVHGIPVVMGGVHPTFMPEEALHYADFVVRGEGERTLIELLDALEKGKSLKDIKGLSYRVDGDIKHNPDRELLKECDLNSLPMPDISVVHHWKSSIIYPISTSRGCPFDCKFCSVVPVFGKGYRFRALDNVIKELRHVATVSKATRFFVDDNFAANKNRTKELLKGMIAEGLTTRWVTQVRVDVAKDPELLDLIAEAGCTTLYIGFESINPQTLESFRKRQTFNDIIQCIKEVKARKISLHGMFVLGADTDNLDVIKETVDFAINSGIDTTQFIALTPLPGTPLFDEMKADGRLLHTDWTKYNLQHVVFRPAQMSARTLQMETIKGMGKFYSWKSVLHHMARFNIRSAAIGVFGRRVVRNALKEIIPYMETIPATISQTSGVYDSIIKSNY